MLLTIPVTPTPKGRPRMTRTGHAYTPQKTRDAEEAIKWYLLSTYRAKPLQGPIQCVIRCFMPIPRSWSNKKQREADGMWHSVRPDWDNISKGVCDAANGILFSDDAQIAQCTVSKIYSKNPRIELELTTLEQDGTLISPNT